MWKFMGSALVAVAALAACTGTPAAKKPTPAKISTLAGGQVVGDVLAPSGIIAQGGGNIVTNTSSNIIAQGGGNLVGNSGGTYQLAAVGANGLGGVRVELCDAALNPLPGVAPVTADAKGHYALSGVPAGVYLVVAGTQTSDKQVAPLLTVVKVTAAGASASVDMATTFVTVALTEGAGGLGDVDPAAFKRASDATARSLTDADVASLADRRRILARMEALAKEVAEVKDGLAAVGRQIADIQAQLADLQKRLGNQTGAGPTPGPFVAPTKVAPYAEGIGDGQSPVVDSDGKLYLADPTGAAILAVAPDGKVTKVAGLVPPKSPYVDDVVAKATLGAPTGIGIEVGPHHSFFIADSTNHALRGLDLDADGGARLVTAAGTGKEGTNDEGDPGPATVRKPYGVGIARDGTVFVTDAAAGSLRYMQLGKLKTAVLDQALTAPTAVAVGADNKLYVADGARVLRLTPQGGLKYAVTELGSGYQGPNGLAVAANGAVLVAEGAAHRLRVVDAATGKTTFTFGGAAVDGATRTEAAFGELTGVAVGSGGSIYVTDKTNHRVWKLAP